MSVKPTEDGSRRIPVPSQNSPMPRGSTPRAQVDCAKGFEARTRPYSLPCSKCGHDRRVPGASTRGTALVGPCAWPGRVAAVSWPRRIEPAARHCRAASGAETDPDESTVRPQLQLIANADSELVDDGLGQRDLELAGDLGRWPRSMCQGFGQGLVPDEHNGRCQVYGPDDDASLPDLA